jgi:Lon protease-like protein
VDSPAVIIDKAPLFPLPNGALLPGELLPLHIFEPRYRKMMEAVRDGQGVIAIATLLPGWETDYHGAPHIAEVVGIGRVVKDRLNDNGTSDIVLHGMTRGRVLSELGGELFRRARVEPILDDEKHPAEIYRLRRGVLTGIADRLRTQRFNFDITAGFDVGTLLDRIASSLDITPEQRVDVHGAVALDQRAALVLELLRERKHRQQLIEVIPSLHAFTLSMEPRTGSRPSPGRSSEFGA